MVQEVPTGMRVVTVETVADAIAHLASDSR